MRYSLTILASMTAGFVGALFAIFIFGGIGVNVNAGPKTITADTVSADTVHATHIIVDGDIKLNSKLTTVLDLTNPGGGHLRIGNNAGTPQADGKIKSGSGSFVVEMGPDIDLNQPDVVISDNGVAVVERVNKSAFLN